MSATGRTKSDGTKTIRSEADFYATPAWCTQAILAQMHGLLSVDVDQNRRLGWLEPACGDGAIIDAVDGYFSDDMHDYRPEWLALDIRPGAVNRVSDPSDRVRAFECDFLKTDPKVVAPDARVIITNPPYSLAQEFVEHALRWKDSHVVFLLRLNFLGSQKRAKLFSSSMPDVYVLPKRPSFTGKGTDATEYAWMVWPAGFHYCRHTGHVEVLRLP